MRYFYFLFLFIPLLFLACSDDDLAAPIPAYITINEIKLNVKQDEGTASAKITDAKVFINDKSIGSFELPATIPIQQTGEVNLKVRAGIFNNGQSNDRADYPFYTTYEQNLVLNPEQEIELKPEVEYFPGAIIGDPWSGEDFESGANFEYSPVSDTTFIREANPDDVFEGYYGLGYLEPEQDFFEAWTPTFSNIPRDGRAVYLEFNYKSTHDIVVAVFTNNQTSRNSIVFFRSRPTWTKVYVKLSSVFSVLSGASNYNLTFGYKKAVGEEGKLFVDNFKLVRY
jgi:hypothetical protein